MASRKGAEVGSMVEQSGAQTPVVRTIVSPVVAIGASDGSCEGITDGDEVSLLFFFDDFGPLLGDPDGCNEGIPVTGGSDGGGWVGRASGLLVGSLLSFPSVGVGVWSSTGVCVGWFEGRYS